MRFKKQIVKINIDDDKMGIYNTIFAYSFFAVCGFLH
jgi:hypothetical protein